MCRIVEALSGRHRCGPHRWSHSCSPVGAVLDGRPTGAVVAAAAQLRVEGVEHVRVDRADLEPAQVGRDVLADVAGVERLGGLRAVELVEVARQQLVDGRARARVALLVDLADEAVASRPRLPLGLRTGRDDLDEVVPLLRDRVHAGVHAHAPGAARQDDRCCPARGVNRSSGHSARRERTAVRVTNRVTPAARVRPPDLFLLVRAWSRGSDSNRRPTAYKAVALPTELHRRAPLILDPVTAAAAPDPSPRRTATPPPGRAR